MNQESNRPKNEPAKKKCINCRREYEHTYPWCRPLRLCRQCGDAWIMTQIKKGKL
jgi:hypothetical protein